MAGEQLKDKLVDIGRRWFANRGTAYRRVFNSPSGKVVLDDLARFCRASESTFHEDSRVHALAEGRREVWLRIEKHLNLSPQELYDLTKGQPVALRQAQGDE